MFNRLLVTDYHHPGACLAEMLSRIKQEPARFPILMVSACATLEVVKSLRGSSTFVIELLGDPIHKHLIPAVLKHLAPSNAPLPVEKAQKVEPVRCISSIDSGPLVANTMNKEPAEIITVTPEQIALVHDFIFGPQHRFDNRVVCIIGHMEFFLRQGQTGQDTVLWERPSLFKALCGSLAFAVALFEWLSDMAEIARLAIKAGTFNPQDDGAFSKELLWGSRGHAILVLLKANELEGYFRRFGDWARAVTAFVKVTLVTIEQGANDSNLNEIRDAIRRESTGLWEKQKSLIGEFNTMLKQRVNDPNLNEIRDATSRGLSGLREKSLIAEFNTTCGIMQFIALEHFAEMNEVIGNAWRQTRCLERPQQTCEQNTP